jgi:hypothetical protein
VKRNVRVWSHTSLSESYRKGSFIHCKKHMWNLETLSVGVPSCGLYARVPKQRSFLRTKALSNLHSLCKITLAWNHNHGHEPNDVSKRIHSSRLIIIVLFHLTNVNLLKMSPEEAELSLRKSTPLSLTMSSPAPTSSRGQRQRRQSKVEAAWSDE